MRINYNTGMLCICHTVYGFIYLLFSNSCLSLVNFWLAQAALLRQIINLLPSRLFPWRVLFARHAHYRCYCGFTESCKNCVLNALNETVHALTGVMRLYMFECWAWTTEDESSYSNLGPNSSSSASVPGFRRALLRSYLNPKLLKRFTSSAVFSSLEKPDSLEWKSDSARLMVQSLCVGTTFH